MARSRPIAGQRARLRPANTPTDLSTGSPDGPPAGSAGWGDDQVAATLLKTRAPRTREDSSLPAQPGSGPRLGLGDWSTGAKALLAGLLAIALTALAAFGLVAYRVRAADQVETARDQASAAAQHDAVAILSYDYRHLDRDFAAARKALTGSFAGDYRATTTKLVRPGATQYHVVVKAEVAAESVVSATADKVVVLLFVNQTTTSTRLDGPRVDLNRVRLTLVKVDGSWLVNNVVAL
jgi:Mce-associated membrane protein